jgi:AcrR family transcriptional regulator
VNCEIGERARLLELIVDYCVEHGVADLSLRRVALAVGSNNRMLLYYFGSKEGLVEAALLAAFDRYPRIGGALDLLQDDPVPLEQRLRRCWRGVSDELNMPFLRLFFEVFGLAAHQPGRFGIYLDRVSHDWTERLTAVVRAEGVPLKESRLLGREIVAIWRGLQFDLLSSGERRAIDRTNDHAMASIAQRVILARAL